MSRSSNDISEETYACTREHHLICRFIELIVDVYFTHILCVFITAVPITKLFARGILVHKVIAPRLHNCLTASVSPSVPGMGARLHQFSLQFLYPAPLLL